MSGVVFRGIKGRRNHRGNILDGHLITVDGGEPCHRIDDNQFRRMPNVTSFTSSLYLPHLLIA